MGDHKDVFRSLQELFPQVDHRILKAVSIEHSKDADSAVVAVLDEVMPSMTGSMGALTAHHEAVDDSPGNLFAHSTCEVGSSSSAGHDTHVDDATGSVHSLHHISSVDVETGTQENVGNKSYVGGLSQMVSEYDCAPNLDIAYANLSANKELSSSDNEGGHGGCLSSKCFSPSSAGENGGDSISIKAPQIYKQGSDNITTVRDCIPQNSSFTSFSGYVDLNNGGDSFLSELLAAASYTEVSSRALSNEKDALTSLPDVPMPDTEGSSVGFGGFKKQKDSSNTDTGHNGQLSGDVAEDGDILLSYKTNMLPDLNLDHFASTASTHSSYSVNIVSLEDYIADAGSNKNDLLTSLDMVTKMIENVELLEQKAKIVKHESSVAGKNILTKVEELKEMLTHAKEANDMHAGEVFGEKSILTTEARELQFRLQRLSEERNRYLVVIEEIRQTLEERLVAAQQEIAAAEKEKIEKEAVAQALLDEQEKVMNSIVEESRRLQKEAEDNLKLKEFLVERGQIVDTLQGEMAVICEDVSLLKQVVDERLSLSKLQRSAMSSLSSSLHSSLHKSGNSSDMTVEAIEPTYKHTIVEAARPMREDLHGNERTVEVSDGNGTAVRDTSKQHDCNSNEEGWDFVDDAQ